MNNETVCRGLESTVYKNPSQIFLSEHGQLFIYLIGLYVAYCLANLKTDAKYKDPDPDSKVAGSLSNSQQPDD